MNSQDKLFAEGCLIIIGGLLGLLATGLIAAHFGCALLACGVYVAIVAMWVIAAVIFG